MKIEITLILILNLLFINNLYAKSAEAIACQSALEKGDVTAALAQANKALSANKNDGDALICQGRGLAANDDFAGALAAFKQANTQAMDAFDKTVASMLMGNTQKQLKQYDEAIASYQAASAQAKAGKVPAYERAAYNAIGNIYALKQDYKSALAQYELGSLLGQPVCGGNCLLGGLLHKVASEVSAYFSQTKLSDLAQAFGQEERDAQA